MTRIFCLLAACVSLQLTVNAQAGFKLSDMTWMAGCWEARDHGKRLLSEQWMAPAGGIMLGIGRAIESEQAIDFEAMRIEQNGKDLVFIARPKANKRETPFKMIKGGPSDAVFENKEYDFPQRVIYRRDGAKLLARIEGKRSGKLVIIDYPMIRAACDGTSRFDMNKTSMAATVTELRKSAMTRVEADEIVAAHNKVRADAKLPTLTWDEKLAGFAQEWATRGIFEHRPENTFGENIFAASVPPASMKAAVDLWISEKTWWDAKAAMCADGKTCTHYTQVVWKATTRIGCGINRNAAGKWRVFVVCNYDPAGNLDGPPF